MNRKKMLTVIAAVAFGIVGAVSSAQAGSQDDDGYGGTKIGPLGQSFGGLPTAEIFGADSWTTKQVRGKKAAGKRD